MDQASIVVRHVKDEETHKRLFAVVTAKDSSAKDINEILQAQIEEHGLKYENVAGESFEGASDMRGKFEGLLSRIKKHIQD